MIIKPCSKFYKVADSRGDIFVLHHNKNEAVCSYERQYYSNFNKGIALIQTKRSIDKINEKYGNDTVFPAQAISGIIYVFEYEKVSANEATTDLWHEVWHCIVGDKIGWMHVPHWMKREYFSELSK